MSLRSLQRRLWHSKGTFSTLKSATDSNSKVITSSSSYTNSGNLISSTTDSAGSTTSYEYTGVLNKTYGIPSKITDSLGADTSYSIDAFGRYQDITVDNGAGLSYIYSNSRLTQIKRMDGTVEKLRYQFAYDAFDNMTSLKVGNKTLASYTYAAANGLLTRQTYGNGDYVSFTYDELGRAKSTAYSDGRVLTYSYTGDGQLYSVHDSETGYHYLYTYDSIGRLVGSSVKNESAAILRTSQKYNSDNQLTAQSWQMGDTAYTESYAYNEEDGSISSISVPTGQTISYNYDHLRRLSSIEAGSVYTRSYEYRDISATQTTTQISSIAYVTSYVEETFMYRYDEQGNIIKFMDADGVDIDYVYDSLGQLVECESDRLYTYTYDKGGNILVATDDGVSHTYTYGDADWADLLTAYDGQTITYDGSGNPISYYNGTRYTFTWEEGRRLTSAVKNGDTYTYAYDHNGIRTSKTVGGVTHTYLYASGKLLRESYGNTVLDFFYDSNGYPYALNYTVDGTTTTYYYITNLQGDVMYIVNSAGTMAGLYEYDPYGDVITAAGTMGQINPLRYRGYYYDSETGFYYLQSRYYDPSIGRFINADTYASTGQGFLGSNMFAYCGNNPICFSDFDGQKASPIGAGVQFEVDIGHTSIGVEVILYWDVDECDNGAPVIAVYAYGGVSVDVDNAYLASILGVITDNADLLVGENGSGAGVMALAALIGESFSVSVSGMIVFGNEDFSSTKDYEKSFTSVGANWGKVRGSVAYSESCTTVSIGANLIGGTNIFPGWGVSKTYYQQLFAYSVPN